MQATPLLSPSSHPPHTVVANSVVALNEILKDSGGIRVNTAIIHHLLSRLNSFNEWGLTHLLTLVAKYKAESDEEIFQIMNLLDPVLRTSNTGVVLAATAAFVQLTDSLPEVQAQVFERMRAPLLTLMSGGSHETKYVVHCSRSPCVQRGEALRSLPSAAGTASSSTSTSSCTNARVSSRPSFVNSSCSTTNRRTSNTPR